MRRSAAAMRHMIREPLLYMGGSGIQRGLPFLLLPVYTRFLTPEGFGLLSLALVGASVAGIFIGLNGQVYIVTKYFDIGPQEIRSTIRFILQLVMVSLGAFLAGGVAWALLLPIVGFGPSVIVTLLLLGASRSVLATFLAVRQVEFRPGAFFGYSAATGVLGATAILAFLHLSHGDWRAALVGETVVTVLVSLVLAARAKLGRGRWYSVDSQVALRYVSFALPLVPHALALWVMSFIDRVMLATMVGPSAVGYFSAAYTAGLALSLVYEALQRTWQPRFFRFLSSGTAGLGPANRLARVIMGMTVVLGAVFMLAGVPLFPIIAGPDYADASVWLIPIGLGLIFHGLHRVVASYLYHWGDTRAVGLITMAGAFVNVFANLILIPKYEGMGAALSTLLAYFFVALVTAGRVTFIRPR